MHHYYDHHRDKQFVISFVYGHWPIYMWHIMHELFSPVDPETVNVPLLCTVCPSIFLVRLRNSRQLAMVSSATTTSASHHA